MNHTNGAHGLIKNSHAVLGTSMINQTTVTGRWHLSLRCSHYSCKTNCVQAKLGLCTCRRQQTLSFTHHATRPSITRLHRSVVLLSAKDAHRLTRTYDRQSRSDHFIDDLTSSIVCLHPQSYISSIFYSP